MPRRAPDHLSRLHGYETTAAARQAQQERHRLAAVAYLQARGGEPATVGTIAAAIGTSSCHLGPILDNARLTFRVRRVSAKAHTGEVQLVELHPHLLPSRVLAG